MRPGGPPPASAALVAVLGDAQRWGFIGPRPVGDHLNHAEGFGRAFEQRAGAPFTGRGLDLGSGGGLPGLVLALRWGLSQWSLVDANQRRTEFLAEAVVRLGLGDRVEVARARAEELGHRNGYRGAFELVTARGFAAPAPTAECGAAFLRADGMLLVSDPPDDEGSPRWTPDGLAKLGLVDDGVVAFESRYHVLRWEGPYPPRYPRRVGIPEKRPLF